MKVLKQIALGLIVFLALSALSLGLNLWVYRELQSRLKIRVSGDYRPAIFIPSFEVRHGTFTWEDRVQLVDGNFNHTSALLLLDRDGRIIARSDGLGGKPDPQFVAAVRAALAAHQGS